MSHIMLDLETLDTKTSAVVLSIGAVVFDPMGLCGETFYVEMTDDTEVQQAHGRTISGKTVNWWMQQDASARGLFADAETRMAGERQNTHNALSAFSNFVFKHGARNARIWGNGADFDNLILGSLYESFNISKPWSYGKNRCYRTMKREFGENIPIKRTGTHHNALDDAITQAVHLQEIYAQLTQK